jgi:hypothetical protein
MYKNFLILLISGVFFVSCASIYGNPEDRIRANMQKSSYSLCKNRIIATLAPREVRNEWSLELERRNEDCSQYSSQILASQAQFHNFTKQLNESGRARPLSTGLIHNFQGSYNEGLDKICLYGLSKTIKVKVTSFEKCPNSIRK